MTPKLANKVFSEKSTQFMPLECHKEPYNIHTLDSQTRYVAASLVTDRQTQKDYRLIITNRWIFSQCMCAYANHWPQHMRIADHVLRTIGTFLGSGDSLRIALWTKIIYLPTACLNSVILMAITMPYQYCYHRAAVQFHTWLNSLHDG